MLLSHMGIVSEHVRLYGVDGSFVELNAADAIDLLGWLLRHNEELLEIMHVQIMRHQAQEQKEEGSNEAP